MGQGKQYNLQKLEKFNQKLKRKLSKLHFKLIWYFNMLVECLSLPTLIHAYYLPSWMFCCVKLKVESGAGSRWKAISWHCLGRRFLFKARLNRFTFLQMYFAVICSCLTWSALSPWWKATEYSGLFPATAVDIWDSFWNQGIQDSFGLSIALRHSLQLGNSTVLACPQMGWISLPIISRQHNIQSLVLLAHDYESWRFHI